LVGRPNTGKYHLIVSAVLAFDSKSKPTMWMDGALEADVALIQTAMNRVDPTIERVSNTQMDTGNAAAVARFGTRLATRGGGPEGQVPEKTGLKKVAERVGFEPTFGTVTIKKLQEKPRVAVPSRPLNSPDFAVDLAIAGYH
jgi:hypothetical protein